MKVNKSFYFFAILFIMLFLLFFCFVYSASAAPSDKASASGDALSSGDALQVQVLRQINESITDLSKSLRRNNKKLNKVIEKVDSDDQLKFYKESKESIDEIVANQESIISYFDDKASVDAVLADEDMEDITLHNFILPENEISDSKILRKIYNLLLLIFVFFILQFLYSEAKALFNKLNL